MSVLDATGDTTDPATARGASTMAALAAQGFVPGAMGIEPAAVPTSLVRYAPDAVEAARTVAAAVPGAVLEPTAAPGAGVQLVVASPDLPVSPVAVGAAVPETALRRSPPPPPAADPAVPGPGPRGPRGRRSPRRPGVDGGSGERAPDQPKRPEM